MQKLPDVVYVVKTAEDNEELRYSLRSLVNVPHGRLFIAGYKPSWLTNCIHIPTEQSGSKFNNSTNNLLQACRNKELSDEFIFMNDDFFIMKPTESIPALHRGVVSEVIRSYQQQRGGDEYIDGMQQTKALLVSMGFTEPISYELHVPILLNKNKFIEVMELQRRLNPHIRVVHKRTLYGNLANLGGIKTDDVKVYKNAPEFCEQWPFISSDDEAFRYGAVGLFVRSRFMKRSQYEVDYE